MNLFSTDVALLSELPLFSGLSIEQLSAIRRQMDRRSFRRGTTILMADDSCGMVYVIQSGLVRVCAGGCTSDRVLLGILGQGEIIGEIGALDGQVHSADVIAAQDCLFWCLTAAVFEECLRVFPDMALNLLRMTVKRLRNTTDKIALLSTQDGTGRVARQLLIFAHQCGLDLPNGAVEIPLSLTQTDIAALTGVSRQTVNGAFQHFRKIEAISTTSSSHIIIHKPDVLALRCR